MSLVPILYTSIILFSVLMFIIISVSYIAYKIRNRNDETEQVEVRTNSYLQNPVVVPPSRKYPPQAIKVIPSIKKPELQQTYLFEERQRSSSQNLIEPKERYSRIAETVNEKPTSRNTERRGQRTNASSFKSRLEIINRVIPEESTKEKFTISGSGTIALPKYYENFRAIQYYSDDEDEYLYKPSRHYS